MIRSKNRMAPHGASDINGTTDFDRTNYFETLPSNSRQQNSEGPSKGQPGAAAAFLLATMPAQYFSR